MGSARGPLRDTESRSEGPCSTSNMIRVAILGALLAVAFADDMTTTPGFDSQEAAFLETESKTKPFFGMDPLMGGLGGFGARDPTQIGAAGFPGYGVGGGFGGYYPGAGFGAGFGYPGYGIGYPSTGLGLNNFNVFGMDPLMGGLGGFGATDPTAAPGAGFGGIGAPGAFGIGGPNFGFGGYGPTGGFLPGLGLGLGLGVLGGA